MTAGALPPEVAAFLDRPGLPGPWGALMDEYARAAADLCRVVEGLALGVYRAERPGDDAGTRSPMAIARHSIGAARGYARAIRKALGLPCEERFALPESETAQPSDLRRHLAAALRHTEETLDPMRGWPGEKVEALTFRVSWGSLYDPEMLMEHAICHLLRHRRQLERWGQTGT